MLLIEIYLHFSLKSTKKLYISFQIYLEVNLDAPAGLRMSYVHTFYTKYIQTQKKNIYI